MKLPGRLKTALLAGGVILTGGSLALTYRWDLDPDDVDDEFVNEDSRFLQLNNDTIHYRDTGEGKNLILLHGTASSLHTWSDWAEKLDDDYRMIRPDLPGFGLTGPRADEQYSTETYLDFLNDFADKLNLRNFTLVGNSYGGYLAIRYALNNPDRVNKMVLLNTMGLEKNWPFPLRIGQYPVLDQLKQFTPKTFVRSLLKHLYGDPEKVTEDRVNRYYRLLRRKGNRRALVSFVKETVKEREFKLENSLGDLDLPVLIQWGLKDPWFPISHAEQLREGLSDVSLVTYLAAGHLPHEEIPEQTAQDANSFLP